MRWGIGLGDLTPELREQMQAPRDVHGAVIEQVQPGSSADNAGLQRGDIILEVNRHKVAERERCAASAVERSERAGCTGAGVVEWREYVPGAAFA